MHARAAGIALIHNQQIFLTTSVVAGGSVFIRILVEFYFFIYLFFFGSICSRQNHTSYTVAALKALIAHDIRHYK